ncbi:MAG: glycosyltransferase [Chloroflexi bacterium]|nr:glycosyltransferase [Chloroflexota bacterium]
MKRITVLVSDLPDGALHERARALFGRLADRYDVRIVCHEGGARRRIAHFFNTLQRARPDLIYIVDPIYAAVVAARSYTWLHRTPMVLDTGDMVYELAKEVGRLGAQALTVVRWAEQTALSMAHTIVVRGDYHRDWLARHGRANVTFIPDGVDLAQYHPTAARPWRARFGISEDDLAVGGVGSLSWNFRRRTGYGWDLVEALAFLRGAPVKGILFGDGDGLGILKARAAELGVDRQIAFAGRVLPADLNDAVNALDVALVSAPDSEISWVRTTGKLPLYLACDRYIISTAVGTAARVLDGTDMLLPYEGIGRDDRYPVTLADRLRALIGLPDAVKMNGRGVALARQHFDYDMLAKRLDSVLTGVLS